MKRVVFIDPGHGGTDPGTVRGVTEEEDLTLDLAKRVGRNIRLLSASSEKDAGPTVETIFSRETDTTTSIDKRVTLATRSVSAMSGKHADVFLSIHVNSANEKYEGAMCLVSQDGGYKTRSVDLAGKILNSLEACGLQNRHVFPDKEPTIRFNYLGVLHGVHWHMPAVLAEVGNIRNDHDYRLLCDADSREVVAIAIARAVLEWLGIEPRMELLKSS